MTKGMIIESRGWRDASVGKVLAEQAEGTRGSPQPFKLGMVALVPNSRMGSQSV